MRIDPIVGVPGNDANLRFVVYQINRKIQELNKATTEYENNINSLELLSFDISKILVNNDGDILVNGDGEVLFEH